MMINKDKIIIMVEDVVGDVPRRANSGACISWTSTTKEEGSFVQYTLRMCLLKRHLP
ncbi:hypothetical protein AAG906_029296 [Vitis piasezkii]